MVHEVSDAPQTVKYMSKYRLAFMRHLINVLKAQRNEVITQASTLCGITTLRCSHRHYYLPSYRQQRPLILYTATWFISGWLETL